jgi:hypothetical protein
MKASRQLSAGFSEADLDFVVEQAAPNAKDKARLKRLVQEDAFFRKALTGDERVFQAVMDDEESFLHISPGLYFEVLLRKARKEMETATYTVERSGRETVAVFDTKEVVDFLGSEEVLLYLAEALASFTRVHSYVVPVRVRRGIRRRLRFNDMDVDSLIRFCATADEEQRFGFYKRIADVCLFVAGAFPDYARADSRYPLSGRQRPLVAGRARRSLEEYQQEGRRFYGLAAEHPAARAQELSEVLWQLREHFQTATKPLNFIAAHYLHSQKHRLFGVQAD